MIDQWRVTSKDRNILRDLGKRLVEAAAHPDNEKRRRLWHLHDEGKGERPMVLAEVGGVCNEVFPANFCHCEEEWARGIEWHLRITLWQFDTLRDDHVIEPEIRLNWQVTTSDYGVQSVQHRPDTAGALGARRWDPALRNLQEDFAKLRPRTYSVDREGTLRKKAFLEEVFSGVLPVAIRGAFWWTLGLTQTAIDLIGLDNLMIYMYDDPEGLHRLMAFLRDDHLAYARWLEREGLLTLNNANDYIGSGSMGYTRALPQPDWRPGMPVRCRDLWALSESQETVGVGPAQFAEFIFPYQKSLTDLFGRIYYGCCEPVHSRWHILAGMANLKRISIAPWCDEEFMAAACGKNVVYSRKPNPTLISTECFDEEAIRADIRRTLSIAARHGCSVELIMKDVHTLNREPHRLPRWVAIALTEAGG